MPPVRVNYNKLIYNEFTYGKERRERERERGTKCKVFRLNYLGDVGVLVMVFTNAFIYQTCIFRAFWRSRRDKNLFYEEINEG